MKLQRKINRSSLWISIVIAILTSIIIHFSFQYIFKEEAAEELHKTRNFIVSELKKGENEFNLPNATVERTHKSAVKANIVEKNIFVPEEEENEKFIVLEEVFSCTNKENYKIEIRLAFSEYEEIISLITILVIGIFFSFLLILWVLNSLNSRKLWKPFFISLEELKKHQIGKNTKINLPHSKVDEFEDLNKLIVTLFTKAESDFLNLKQFSENASHEFQTPIAILRLKLDQLMQSKNLKEEDFEVVSSLFETLNRLNKLSKDLLTLSKIENLQLGAETIINLELFMKNKVTEFQDLLDTKNIQLTIKVQEILVLKTSEYLLDILLNNLLKNAIIYNELDGFIEVFLDKNCLRIRNSGINSNLHNDTIFQRFVKGNSSSSSNGIGLAIVKQIVDQNSWTIRYEQNENLHEFILNF